MKITLIHIAVISLLVGCSQTEKKENAFIGTFVRHTKDETGSLDDTLYITHVGDPGANLYAVVRKMGVVNIGSNDSLLPKEYKEVKWSAEYKPNEKHLEIVNTGERYVLEENDKGITNGQLSYKRIN